MDFEARLHSEHPDELRLWLRMLTCTQLIEQRIRARLRDSFGISLARFDLLSQLERAPEGMRMRELSRRLMVTGGNVTGLTDQLESEGVVERLPVAEDRRAYRICLTKKGKREFKEMATQHEGWIVEAFSGMDKQTINALYLLLGEVKQRQYAMKEMSET